MKSTLKVVIRGLLLSACGLAVSASAIQLSLGVRETGAGGGSDVGIGGNAGTSGGIEWINLDGQSLNLDGLWHAYTWNLRTDPVTAFAGGTANGVLDGAYGSIENLRFLNNTGITGPITVYVDYVVNTVSSGPVVVQDFENFADTTEVMFQEPGYSGSTEGNLAAGSSDGVDSSIAFHGAASYKVQWSFLDNDPTRWLRLTTYQVANGGNPEIRFDQDSQVTVYMMAVVPEPTSGLLLLLGGAACWLVRRRA